MSTPAGWYPDPSGVAGTRWWDGAQWTSHAQPPAYPAGGYAAVPAPPAKVEVPTSTVWVWLAIAASALPYFTIFLMDWHGFIDAIVASAARGVESSYLLSWQLNSLLVSLISWGAIALYILFSWLDWRELRKRGIVRPFHWAWAFFGLLTFGVAVYMIGRAVVLRAHREGVVGAFVGLDRRDRRRLHRRVRVGLLVHGNPVLRSRPLPDLQLIRLRDGRGPSALRS